MPSAQASFSPDGEQVISVSSDKTVQVSNAHTGQLSMTLRQHERDVISIDFSADGTRFVTASEDRTARVWDLSTGAELAVLGEHEGWVNAARFSPDGQKVITSTFGSCRIWDVRRTAFSSGKLETLAAGLTRGRGFLTEEERADILMKDAPPEVLRELKKLMSESQIDKACDLDEALSSFGHANAYTLVAPLEARSNAGREVKARAKRRWWQ